MGMSGFGSIPLDDTRPCSPVVFGDTTRCMACGFEWDTGDTPPACFDDAKPRRLSRVITWPLATLVALAIWAALIWGGVQAIEWVRA